MKIAPHLGKRPRAQQGSYLTIAEEYGLDFRHTFVPLLITTFYF